MSTLANFFLLVCGCIGTFAVHANCLQSFNVKPDAIVSDFTWIPGSGFVAQDPISCIALERSRQALFISGEKKIDPVVLSEVSKYESELNKLSDRIAKTKLELDSKLAADASLEALRLAFEIILYDLAKAATLIGCAAPDPTMLSKALCAVGLVSTAKDSYSILSGNLTKQELSSKAQKLTSDITQMENAKRSLLAKQPSFNMDSAEKKLNETFLNMCETVKKSCL